MKSMLKKVITGGTKKTLFTSATKRAALLIIATANLIRLYRHRKVIAHKPAKPKTAYARYLRYLPSFSMSESLFVTPFNVIILFYLQTN